MKKVVELYLNFQVYDIFLDSVVKDKRSFQPEVFERTADLLENNNVLESHLVADFRTLLKKIYNMQENQFQINDIEDSEIPE